MPAAEARLVTDRASRYLVQLCRHLDQLDHASQQQPGGHGQGHGAGHGPGHGEPMPAVRHVDHSDTAGTVQFTDGRWTLTATADTLTLRVDADDEEALRRLRDAITVRVETIGRRDGLRTYWHPAGPDA